MSLKHAYYKKSMNFKKFCLKIAYCLLPFLQELSVVLSVKWLYGNQRMVPNAFSPHCVAHTLAGYLWVHYNIIILLVSRYYDIFSMLWSALFSWTEPVGWYRNMLLVLQISRKYQSLRRQFVFITPAIIGLALSLCDFSTLSAISSHKKTNWVRGAVEMEIQKERKYEVRKRIILLLLIQMDFVCSLENHLPSLLNNKHHLYFSSFWVPFHMA